MALWLPLILLLSHSVPRLLEAAVFTVINNCPQTIYAGTAGQPMLMNGGFELGPSANQTVEAPPGWSGRFWGRTGCHFDQMGKGTCVTGDCGGAVQCNGTIGKPPVSVVEFTLGLRTYYDVSLVDGFNLPISITPSSGGCTEVECVTDINQSCPPELREMYRGRVVGCKSACNVLNKPKYCCTDYYNSPETCTATNYSQLFKSACSQAYSYLYDDKSSTFTCSGGNFTIAFCGDSEFEMVV